MKELNEMTLVEIKALEDAIKARKAELKVSAKADKVSEIEAKTTEVNAMISGNTLKVGMNVVILYGSKNEEIVGEIVGVLSTDKATLTIASDSFDGKANDKGEKRRYIKKDRFVRIAD